jgi:hypothetical protein
MPRFRSSLITAALLATSMAGRTSYDPSPSVGTQSLEAQRQAAIATLPSTALRPLMLCHAENPPAWGSTRLDEAGATVLKVASLLTPEQSGVDAVNDRGILEGADDTRAYGGKAMARRLYDGIIEIYLGGDSAAPRQSAQIGIDDLRR